MSAFQPSLSINYCPDFSLTIQFSRMELYEVAGPEYFFDVACKIHHPTGQFAYTGRNICFSPQTFQEFAEQLEAIRSGKGQRAQFHEAGTMINFWVEAAGRNTKATVRILEYQPNGEQTVLSASFRVDYDLFVNALYRAISQFSTGLERVEPV